VPVPRAIFTDPALVQTIDLLLGRYQRIRLQVRLSKVVQVAGQARAMWVKLCCRTMVVQTLFFPQSGGRGGLQHDNT
jgi:hypothetical protein